MATSKPLFEERPKGPDWERFCCDLARAMKQHGFSVGLDVLFTYEEVKQHPIVPSDLSKSQWLNNYFGTHLNLNQLERDLGEYRHGGEGLIFSTQYCSDNLIKDDAINYEENARSLSRALEEELPRERKRLGIRKTRERALPEDVATRRPIVKAAAKTNPRLKGKGLDKETCETLDLRRVSVSERWKRLYGVKTWGKGYEHDHVRGLIHRMFSNDRKAPL